jgi:CheY-like chemotaxis protein
METILIADDDQDLCYVCKRELRYEGYAKRLVTSHPEALRFTSENPQLELIILDVRIAPLDGI